MKLLKKSYKLLAKNNKKTGEKQFGGVKEFHNFIYTYIIELAKMKMKAMPTLL